jgi:two-component system sensor histidine kinase BaeS
VTVSVHADDASFVEASPLELSRALRNLIENAVHHSPPAGTVAVTLHHVDDGIELRVRDDGPGFPPDFRERAFDPFTRADPARRGRNGHAGLGLTIARAVVEAHGGRIWLGTAPGGDVRFWLPSAPLPRRQAP